MTSTPTPVINFQEIINKALPSYSRGAINIKKANLTIGDVLTGILPYLFVSAGLVLFFYLLIGGFTLLFAAGNPEKIKAGQAKITSALIGFLIVFTAYWLIRILEVVLGVRILG